MRRKGCACRGLSTPKGRSFDPSKKPDEWKEIGYNYNRSQFHSDYGTVTYRCEVCGSIINVEFLEREDDIAYSIKSIGPDKARR